jgi:acetyl-CoA carboxylase carboxyl transferase subunit alpha
VEILLELHGDRGFKDDKAMIGGLGKLVVSLYDCWSTKGYNTKTVNTETSGWQIRRISKSAALDENGREVWYSCSDAYRYSGAYPGLEAEERGQGELSPEIYLKWYV